MDPGRSMQNALSAGFVFPTPQNAFDARLSYIRPNHISSDPRPLNGRNVTGYSTSESTEPPRGTLSMSQTNYPQRGGYVQRGANSDEDDHLFLPTSPSTSLPGRPLGDDSFSHPARNAQDWSYFVEEPEETKVFTNQQHYRLHVYDQSHHRVIQQLPVAHWKTSSLSHDNDPEESEDPERTANEGPPKKRYIRHPTYAPRPPPEADPQQDGSYMREAFSLSDTMELTLAHLADPTDGGRPMYPLPLLAALAIHGSPNRRLTLQEIFREIEKRFTWYANTEDSKSWRNSIRHLLSLHKIFRQVPRPLTEPGKGHYWRLDFSEGVGNKRERKRRKKGLEHGSGTATPGTPKLVKGRSSSGSDSPFTTTDQIYDKDTNISRISGTSEDSVVETNSLAEKSPVRESRASSPTPDSSRAPTLPPSTPPPNKTRGPQLRPVDPLSIGHEGLKRKRADHQPRRSTISGSSLAPQAGRTIYSPGGPSNVGEKRRFSEQYLEDPSYQFPSGRTNLYSPDGWLNPMVYGYNQLGRENLQLRTLERELGESRAETNAYRTQLAKAHAEIHRLDGEIAHMKAGPSPLRRGGDSSGANGPRSHARMMSKGSSATDHPYDSESETTEDLLISRNEFEDLRNRVQKQEQEIKATKRRMENHDSL